MAVQARYGELAGVFPAACFDPRGGSAATADVQMLAPQVVDRNGYHCAAVVSGAQSGLTCNNIGGGGAGVVSRKRGREMEQYVQPSSTSLLLPIPGLTKMVPSPSMASAMASTSGRLATTFGGALSSSELYYRHKSEIDALVRAESERLRAGRDHARKQQCQSLVRAVSALATRRLQEKEAELEASRRRSAELEERLHQAETRPSPRGSVPRSTMSSSVPQHRPPPKAPAITTRPAQPTTRSHAASRRRTRRGGTTAPARWPGGGLARRVASARRRCCYCRAGTCACAARASRSWRLVPSASQARTPPSWPVRRRKFGSFLGRCFC